MCDAAEELVDDAPDAMMEYVPRATSKIDLPASTIIRKARNGRASLYSEGANFAFTSMHSSCSVTRQATTSVFHKHLASPDDADAWSTPRGLACWHCTEPFEGPGVPLPRSFDMKERMFVVYGHFCSLACAKGFVLSESGFDQGQKVINLTRMANQVYGVDEVRAAPSRYALKKYGGNLTIEEFRAGVAPCRVVEAPFICNYMVVEECAQTKSNVSDNWRQSIRGMRRPAQPVRVGPAEQPATGKSLYEEFMETRRGEDVARPPPAAAARRREAPRGVTEGGLSQLMKG